jgi:hypothetical protein
MKYFSLFLLLLLGWLPSAENAPADDPYGEQAVSNALSVKGGSLSFTEKAVNRLGDRAAIGLMRLFAAQPVASPDQVKGILLILRNAFSAPSIIVVDADREPKATLFLLQYLQTLSVSRNLGPEISETKAFVLRNTKTN